jgi:aspartate/methionine/tyrosine aminotransferase
MPFFGLHFPRTILTAIPGGSGAYSHSAGIEKIRQNVAKFIEGACVSPYIVLVITTFLPERDGFPSDANEIFLTNGASPAIQNVLTILIRNEKDGVLIPIPQYPLYTASIRLFGGSALPYELDEDNGWALRVLAALTLRILTDHPPSD